MTTFYFSFIYMKIIFNSFMPLDWLISITFFQTVMISGYTYGK